MSIFEAITLFTVMAVLAALPSSSVALVIARSATLGTANGIAVAIGIVLGDLVFVVLAIAGLSLVAETLGSFFVVIKILGGLYLIYLGVKLLKAKAGSFRALTNAEKSKGLFTSVAAGFFLTLGDVKAIFFYASLFPMFVNVSGINTQEIFTIIAITIISVGSVKVLYAVLGTKVAYFARHPEFGGTYQKTAGALLVGTGSYVAFKV